MKLPSYIVLMLLVCLVAVQLDGQGERLGDLTSNSIVSTDAKPFVKDGYPVFNIHVPAPYTEVQIRASITNFEPGFILRLNGTAVYNFIPLVDQPKVAGRWVYRALGTDNVIAQWSIPLGRFECTVSGAQIFTYDPLPQNATWSGGAWGYTSVKEAFVYRTCTTGQAADGAWGQGSGDPDPWVFIPKQDASVIVGEDQFRRQKWNWATSLSSQINTVPTPWTIGNTVLYQPSRGNLGSSEWMQQNVDRLVWVYQLETATGTHELQPNGVPVWHVMHPIEWRKNRINLPTP